jgi:hypothetical protein
MKARELIAGVAAGVCILPSGLCNVLPQLTAALAGQTPAMTMAAFQGVSVIVIALAPFGMKKINNYIAKAFVFAGAGFLMWLSFVNAVELAGVMRESATGVARGSLSRAEFLNSRIRDLENSRKKLPQFEFTTAAQVTAAQTAVQTAEVARDKECNRVGDKCRQRQDEAAAAVEKLSKIEAQRGLTEKAEGIDRDLSDAKGELSKLGPLPKYADASAARIARVLGTIMKADDESVSEWRPVWTAFGFDILALIGPFVIFSSMLSGPVPEKQQPCISGMFNGLVRPRLRESAAVLVPAGVPQTPVTPAMTKQPKKIKGKPGAAVTPAREYGEPLDWHNSRTIPRPANEIRAQDCFADYVQWCQAMGLQAYNLTTFGIRMREIVKAPKIERSKRTYYVGFALKGAALKIVAG